MSIGLIVLLALLGVLAVAIIANFMAQHRYLQETTVTTHYDEPEEVVVVGDLKRQFSNGQPYVIDPADNKKIWLNTSDTHYEDEAGKNWRLV